jgi:chromosome segregation ATPase
MPDSKSSLDKLVSEIKQQRDELKLQMHLASMEAKDEYERLSGKYDELTEQYEPVSDAVEETAENLFAALGLAAGEIKTGFQRVRKAITESK